MHIRVEGCYILGFEIDHTSINTVDASHGCNFWTTSAATSCKKQHKLSTMMSKY